LSISPALFKSTKPTAVYFGDEKVAVKTWRKTYILILQRCAVIPENLALLMSLRNKINGRNRKFLFGRSREKEPIKYKNIFP